MRKIVIHHPGGYERLCIEQHADLVPGQDEVLVDDEAVEPYTLPVSTIRRWREWVVRGVG